MLENTCKMAGNCPFFNKYSIKYPRKMDSFKKTYCEGTLAHICIGKTHFDELGGEPPVSFDPTGSAFKPEE